MLPFFTKNIYFNLLVSSYLYKCLQDICDSFEKSDIKKELLAQMNYQEQNEKKNQDTYNNSVDFIKDEIAYRSSFFKQMYWLMWRNCNKI